MDRLLFIDVMNERNKSTYEYKKATVKVIGSILGTFELEIQNDPKPCFEEINDFLNNAIKLNK